MALSVLRRSREDRQSTSGKGETARLTGRAALQEMADCGLFVEGSEPDVRVPDALRDSGVAVARQGR